MSACVSGPNAQMQCELPGTCSLEKLHVDEKYLGTNGEAARLKKINENNKVLQNIFIIIYLECLDFCSSSEKTCTVP